MRVLKIDSNIINPKFKSSGRSYFDQTLKYSTITEGEISNYTELFRNDIVWPTHIQFLDQNFSDVPKVNIYCLACSDCSEAYSLNIALKEKSIFPEKYGKILCVDRDPVIIEAAKSRRINLSDDDIARLNKFVGGSQKYFIDKDFRIPISQETTEPMSSYAVSKELCDKTEIVLGDILTTIKNIKDQGNSVVYCRNVFPYMREETQTEISNALLKVLKPGSIVAIGSFDSRSLFAEIMFSLSAKNRLYYPNIQKAYERITPLIYRRI